MKKTLVAVLVLSFTVSSSAENFPDSVSRTALASSVTSTNIYTAAPMGFYRISYYIVTTTASSAGTVVLSLSWNDGTGTQSFSTGTMALSVLATFSSGSIVVWSGAQQNIAYSTNVTGVVGSPQYAVRISLERLQ